MPRDMKGAMCMVSKTTILWIYKQIRYHLDIWGIGYVIEPAKHRGALEECLRNTEKYLRSVSKERLAASGLSSGRFQCYR